MTDKLISTYSFNKITLPGIFIPLPRCRNIGPLTGCEQTRDRLND
jgi:hypothetical protein